MRIVETVASLREAVSGWRARPGAIGLAPTMGGLHAGHLSLIEALRREGATRVVATIFVNPTQFGANEDFDAYPRPFEADRRRLEDAGVDLLFAPPVEEVYPPGDHATARIDVPALSSDLCGQFRPGHFAAVATVVAKLLNMVQPDLAAFGEKDYQQLIVIRRMVESLDFPVRIVACPTVREADGLALSSRNQYLTAEERAVAPELHATLVKARAELVGGAPVAEVEKDAAGRLSAAGFTVDYVSVRRAGDLARAAASVGELVILVAARLGATRLIDNLRIEIAGR